jgi:hypothetical protein
MGLRPTKRCTAGSAVSEITIHLPRPGECGRHPSHKLATADLDEPTCGIHSVAVTVEG